MNTAPVMINMKQMREKKKCYRTYHDQVEHLIQVGIALRIASNKMLPKGIVKRIR